MTFPGHCGFRAGARHVCGTREALLVSTMAARAWTLPRLPTVPTQDGGGGMPRFLLGRRGLHRSGQDRGRAHSGLLPCSVAAQP